MKIILASGSPRRKELLGLIVPEFEVQVSGVDESLEEGLTPSEQVTRLAYIKAKDVFDKTEENRIVIGSDTIVTKNGKIYGKPHSREHAKEMIKELISGDRMHSIETGLCILSEKDGVVRNYNTFDEARVLLKEISDEEIERWIDTGHAMDKAGAYGIQNEFCVFVEKMVGNYTTIVGLPTHLVYDELKRVGEMRNCRKKKLSLRDALDVPLRGMSLRCLVGWRLKMRGLRWLRIGICRLRAL